MTAEAARHLYFGVEHDQGRRAVGAGRGVGHVAAQRSDVAHLRPADDAAALHQTGGMLGHEGRLHDLRVRDCCADLHDVVFELQRAATE